MIITDPAAVVTRYIDAVRDGDTSAIRECFAEDAKERLSAWWGGPGRRSTGYPRGRPPRRTAGPTGCPAR
jgi:hypothetical protein